MINESQRIIIEKAQTPAAVIAGPGTGKTYTIVKSYFPNQKPGS